MKRIIAPLALMLLLPAAAFAAIEYDYTLPDSIGWGICFSLLLLIMGYRFGEGPSQLCGTIVLGYWGFQTWAIFHKEKAPLVPEEVHHIHLIATLVMTIFAFLAFLQLCKRRRD